VKAKQLLFEDIIGNHHGRIQLCQPSAILGGKTRPENTVSSFQHM